uniref:HMG box domain-containing protein n=1 Tax=Ditylenchus dipsaci TaxID=166011 RepID=A0A915E179_9BILA
MFCNLTRQFRNIVIVQLSRCSTKPKVPLNRPPGYLAPTSFALYLRDFSEKNPSNTPTDTVVAAAKSWKDINEELKKSYQEKSKQIDQERKSAYESLSDEDKLKLHKDHDKAVDEKKKRKKRKERRELNEQSGRPKLPPTAFAIFLKGFFNSRSTSGSGESSTTVIMTEAANSWKELTVDEKEKYRAEAAVGKNEYDMAIKIWKASQNEHEVKVSKEKQPKEKKLIAEKPVKSAANKKVKPATTGSSEDVK